MLQRLLLSATVFGALTFAYTATSEASTTVTSCSYESGTGGIPPTPIPTVGTLTTTFTTQTRDTLTIKSTITVTAPTTVTVTQQTAIVYTAADATVTLPTSTTGVGFRKTVATGVFAATVCSNGAKPVTVTKYTGTYTPISGQTTAIPATYPTRAFCSTGVTRLFILFPTVTSGAVTTTVTPTSTVTAPTTTSTSTIIFGTQYEYSTTVTVSVTTYTPYAVTTTSTVSCAEKTVTKTLAAECAPSNVIGAINGEGLQSGRYADRTSVIYTRLDPWANDPSACCQACLDNKGCGASMGGGGACGLYYTATVDAEPVCDAFIFSFTSTPMVLPGQGLIMQNGCGTVEYQPKL
ncbi:hypothetical protein E0Z10_g7509 [Xylaria hypoxylon]|uniref:Apple domain-containing protein n=1 Tax=Xylaria hypoxylon TaxID=37992 RepID=A0A4Z0YPW9_9PEZI|nr:hypothetical protein E0Z10_g7509 [Xylaria hypoxylon]